MGEKRGILWCHEQSCRHQTAATSAANLLQVSQQQKPSVAEQLNTQYADTVARNRGILRSFLDVIIVLGR